MVKRYNGAGDRDADGAPHEGWVVLLEDVGGNVEVVGWDNEEGVAVAGVLRDVNRPLRHDLHAELPDDCYTYPATAELLAALDADPGAPWRFDTVEGVLDFDERAVEDLARQADEDARHQALACVDEDEAYA